MITPMYALEPDRFGGILLRRHSDNASIYFQPGDDAEAMRDELDALNVLWSAPTRHLISLYKNFENHLDVVLDAYSEVLNDSTGEC